MKMVRSPGGRLLAIGLTKSYLVGERRLPVLAGVDMKADPGEFVALLGPSGCGKSTLLELLCGLQRPDAGELLVDGAPVTAPGHVAYMPQRDALLPWRTVLDNVTLGLVLQGVPRAVARAQARQHLDLFGLSGFATSYPRQLSGGMRQRAALLRTYLSGRPILVLDEPFGALDAITRRTMQQWLAKVHADMGATIVMVTHDIEEALVLADRVYLLSPRPARVYAELPLDLPRPRQVVDPTFNRHKAALLSMLSQFTAGMQTEGGA